MIELSNEAGYGKGSNKVSVLDRASVKLNTLRFFIRLMKDTKTIDSKKYLAKDLNYFSFLRKYSELQIAKIFVKYPQYFNVFSSCNRGLILGKRWCNDCPKCLFTYLILSPYLKEKQLIKIFGKNLLEDKNLLPILKKLTGKKGVKPFECVGTYEESRTALKLNNNNAE